MVVLVGCSAKFDNAEYSKLVDMRALVDTEVCVSHDSAQARAKELSFMSGWLVTYSTYLPRNKPTQDMVAAVDSTIKTFEHRYKISNPSETYCRLQMDIISNQLDMVLEASGDKRR